ncbi:Alkaline protease 2 [Erysiphe neolycopersici]|uniref:Alkaline protease 2 n=1 Tax=Erysiphe neolycopersici TaxID=212602 RepID=A0A420I757_9PEZI|nr:Alkaline protease 2 [Erysiphe neolycopersici]
MRNYAVLLLLPLLATAAPSFLSDKVAPLYTKESATEISNSYIVVFKKHVTKSSADDHHTWLDQVHNQAEARRSELRKRGQFPINDLFQGLKHKYNIAGKFMGYSGHFDDGVIDKVRKHPDVEFVEKDSIVHTLTQGDGLLENQAPWGLARISHRHQLNFGNFNKYLYASGTGKGVDVYVIDTGINIEHIEFEGRAFWGTTIPINDIDQDENGHGTHCSGTIAGKKYGVAKEANIIAVKVLSSNGSGSMSDVVKGVDFATNSHLEKVKNKIKGFKGSVANMSLGGGKSTALDYAVNGAVSSGVHFAVAAGNDNADSCLYSPAAAELAITVGASTLSDERAYFSNYGKCNDIFAPGLNIMSAWTGSKDAVKTISGTSMASPHIAGLIAYYLSLQPDIDSDFAVSQMTPELMKKNIIDIGTKDILSDLPSDTSNVLAWNGGGKSNFSAIVGSGDYSVENKIQDDINLHFPTTIELLKDAMENDFEAIAGTIVSNAESVTREVLSAFEGKLEPLCEEMVV